MPWGKQLMAAIRLHSSWLAGKYIMIHFRASLSHAINGNEPVESHAPLGLYTATPRKLENGPIFRTPYRWGESEGRDEQVWIEREGLKSGHENRQAGNHKEKVVVRVDSHFLRWYELNRTLRFLNVLVKRGKFVATRVRMEEGGREVGRCTSRFSHHCECLSSYAAPSPLTYKYFHISL